jgi:hypothetical protein
MRHLPPKNPLSCGSYPFITMPAKYGFELRDSDIELMHSVHQLRIANI